MHSRCLHASVVGLTYNLPRNVADVNNSGYHAKDAIKRAAAEYCSPEVTACKARLALLAPVPGTGSVPQNANVYAGCHDVTDVTDEFECYRREPGVPLWARSSGKGIDLFGPLLAMKS
jgi:hypothetical protein